MCSLKTAQYLANFATTLVFLPAVASKIFNEADVNAIIPVGYEKVLPREANATEPVVINVEFTLLGVKSLNLQTMEISLEFELTSIWFDRRLESVQPSRVYNVITQEKLQANFWIPHLEFTNYISCKSNRHGLMPMHEPRLYYKPHIKYLKYKYARLQCSFDCQFDLSAYPFDKHSCKIGINLMGYSKIVSQLNGQVGELTENSELRLPPAWKLTTYYVTNCSDSSIYVCTEIVFVLGRLLGHHLLTIFIPSFLIVLLSFISFTMDIAQPAPRVALGLTTLLTLSTQFLNSQKELPPVNYVKAVDIWMVACMISVFMSLMEFAISNYISRRLNETKTYKENVLRVRSELHSDEGVVTKNCINPAKIDRVAGSIISLMFMFFVIVFWVHYY